MHTASKNDNILFFIQLPPCCGLKILDTIIHQRSFLSRPLWPDGIPFHAIYPDDGCGFGADKDIEGVEVDMGTVKGLYPVMQGVGIGYLAAGAVKKAV